MNSWQYTLQAYYSHNYSHNLLSNSLVWELLGAPWTSFCGILVIGFIGLEADNSRCFPLSCGLWPNVS